MDMLRYMSVTHVAKLQRSMHTRNLPDGAFWLEEGDAESVTTVIEINAPQNYLSTSYASSCLFDFYMRAFCIIFCITWYMFFLRFLFYRVMLELICEELHHSQISKYMHSFMFKSLKIQIMY